MRENRRGILNLFRAVIATWVMLFALTGAARASDPPVYVPALDQVAHDKGQIAHGRCRALAGEPVTCTYGDLASANTVALIGDSHALQWGPALIQLAEQHDWRLLVFIKTGCPIADVHFEPTCDQWRHEVIGAVAAERPSHVIVGTSIGRRYQLPGKATRWKSEPALVKGMTRTLRRLAAIPSLAQDGVAVIRDQVAAPFLPVACLQKNPEHPEKCRFKRHRNFGPGFEFKAAKKLGIRKVIDPLEAICRSRWCYAATVDNVVIYRDSDHLTATFALYLTDWLGSKLGF